MAIRCSLLRSIMNKNKDKNRKWTEGKSQKRRKALQIFIMRKIYQVAVFIKISTTHDMTPKFIKKTKMHERVKEFLIQ